ncbi:unnamed protein product [Linum tenue]|uniref:Uncharacterized protein n=2 Tax=Linum tenue TaxID=586396 RepID=A0AAV0LL32_9ROSI|nr:unnamed protein product [Linum tenue]
MAATSHVRSISLPTGTHPTSLAVEVQLERLRSSESASTADSTTQLNILRELHECVDDLLQLPATQKSLSKSMEESLINGSLRSLEICGATREIFAQLKDCVKSLESSLRRKSSDLTSEIETFVSSTKRLRKLACKTLKSSKKSKSPAADLEPKDSIFGLLREVESASFGVFESLLSSVSGAESSGWSVVSKYLKSKQDKESEMGKLQSELMALKSSLRAVNSVEEVQKVLKGLKGMEWSLQESEEELECVYRKLVKTRVSFLNILNH